MLSLSQKIMISASSSVLTISLSGLESNNSAGYQVVCSNEDFLANDNNHPYSQTSNHTISVLVNSFNTSNVEVRDLVPGLSYNCCVSALEEFNNDTYCVNSMLSSGLSWPVVGVIGAAIGAVVTALVLLAILGTVCVLYKTCR